MNKFERDEPMDVDNLPNLKRTPQKLYLDAKAAYAFKQKKKEKVLFIDVRTCPELEFVGLPDLVDINIPYMINRLGQWDANKKRFPKEVNRNFLPALEKRLDEYHMNKDSLLLLICRSGNRSAWAASLLYQVGYEQVYTVIDGFEGDTAKSGKHKGKRLVNGWKNVGLPWTYQLEERQLYEENLSYYQ